MLFFLNVVLLESNSKRIQQSITTKIWTQSICDLSSLTNILLGALPSHPVSSSTLSTPKGHNC